MFQPSRDPYPMLCMHMTVSALFWRHQKASLASSKRTKLTHLLLKILSWGRQRPKVLLEATSRGHRKEQNLCTHYTQCSHLGSVVALKYRKKTCMLFFSKLLLKIVSWGQQRSKVLLERPNREQNICTHCSQCITFDTVAVKFCQKWNLNN